MNVEFGSVCSGIEAASVAWHPLGWRAAWLAEIEAFPSAVLAHHYPDVPNLGDMTTIARRVLSGEVSAPDLLCGGTPCQAFSVAGLRASLDDERGNLTLKFVELADAIDHVRVRAGRPPAVIVWENVPGVLSTKDNAFGCFLAGLAGEDEPLQPPGGKWSNAGAVLGPKRAIAWRTLDAQYFGVAQRRRRVFVVASAREDFDPAAILFEWQGVRRDSAPSREQGKVAPTIPARSLGGGGLGTDFDLDGGLIQAFGGNQTSGPRSVASALSAHGGTGRHDFETETFLVQPCVTGDITHALKAEGFDASEDGTGRGQPIVPAVMRESGQGYWMQDEIAGTLRAEGEDRPSRPSHVIGVPVAFVQNSRDEVRLMGGDGGIVGALASETGAKQQCYVAAPVAFHPTQDPISSTDGSTHALGCGSKSGQASVAVAIRTANTGANGHGISPGLAHTLDQAQGQAVAVALRGRDGGATAELGDEVGNALRASGGGGDKAHVLAPVAVQASQSGVRFNETIGTLDANYGSRRHNGIMESMQVRRLTPTECERLQGFPDGYTNVPHRGKPAADGPRYKALGNSWAVPCARWIGQRIQAQLELGK